MHIIMFYQDDIYNNAHNNTTRLMHSISGIDFCWKKLHKLYSIEKVGYKNGDGEVDA